MTLLKKFALTEKQYLTVSLKGLEVELRLSSYGQRTLVLTAAEFENLYSQRQAILENSVCYSTIPGFYGGTDYRKCIPKDGLQFVREYALDTQTLVPDGMRGEHYKLSKNSARVFVEILPKVKDCVDRIAQSQAAISLAYTVVQDQMRRLCDVNTEFSGVEHFHLILRLLHQQVPVSFLVSDFKRRSPGTMLNIFDLFKNVLSQYEHLYYLYNVRDEEL